MSTKQKKRRSKSENEASSLWEQFQLNSTENPSGKLTKFGTMNQNSKDANSLWEQFQLNNTEILSDDRIQNKNNARKEIEVNNL